MTKMYRSNGWFIILLFSLVQGARISPGCRKKGRDVMRSGEIRKLDGCQEIECQVISGGIEILIKKRCPSLSPQKLSCSSLNSDEKSFPGCCFKACQRENETDPNSRPRVTTEEQTKTALYSIPPRNVLNKELRNIISKEVARIEKEVDDTSERFDKETQGSFTTVRPIFYLQSKKKIGPVQKSDSAPEKTDNKTKMDKRYFRRKKNTPKVLNSNLKSRQANISPTDASVVSVKVQPLDVFRKRNLSTNTIQSDTITKNKDFQRHAQRNYLEKRRNNSPNESIANILASETGSLKRIEPLPNPSKIGSKNGRLSFRRAKKGRRRPRLSKALHDLAQDARGKKNDDVEKDIGRTLQSEARQVDSQLKEKGLIRSEPEAALPHNNGDVDRSIHWISEMSSSYNSNWSSKSPRKMKKKRKHAFRYVKNDAGTRRNNTYLTPVAKIPSEEDVRPKNDSLHQTKTATLQSAEETNESVQKVDRKDESKLSEKEIPEFKDYFSSSTNEYKEFKPLIDLTHSSSVGEKTQAANDGATSPLTTYTFRRSQKSFMTQKSSNRNRHSGDQPLYSSKTHFEAIKFP